MNSRKVWAALPADAQARLIVFGVDTLLTLGRQLVQRIGQSAAPTHAELLAQLRGIAIADTDAAIEAGRARAHEEGEGVFIGEPLRRYGVKLKLSDPKRGEFAGEEEVEP